jgi:hypothetical protein
MLGERVPALFHGNVTGGRGDYLADTGLTPYRGRTLNSGHGGPFRRIWPTDRAGTPPC